ncbi:uncharacterized protein LOC128985347 [Macrosteles quadrilineatus]|uniref:uncharacterized protein LOC128985347 n=1 Tax=Macrosteles quadrilineatus TaxID=74068 RepID=UPI0023E32721|nr:uncharacterized protein LOC128985347 [Macrosteles quadrilineatus]
MDSRSKIGILLIVYALQLVLCYPSPLSSYRTVDSALRIRRSDEKETGRIFWSAVGDILESLPFLPFTVNVPDMISGVWNFFAGFFPGAANKRPKRNSTEVVSEVPITRQDVIDYFFYDE